VTIRPIPRNNRTSRLRVAALTVISAVGLLVVAPAAAGAQTPDPSTTAPPTTTPATTAPPAPAPGAPTLPSAPSGPTAPTAPTTTTPATSPQAIQLAITLSRNADKLATTNQQLAQTQARLDQAQAELAETEKRLTDNTARLTQLKDELQTRAAIMYQRKGSEIGAVLNIDQIQNVAASEQYVAAAAGFDDSRLDELKKVQRSLEQEHAQRDSTRATIASAKDQLASLQAQLTDLIAQEKKLLDQLGGVPVMGDAQLTADQVAAWYQSTGQRAKLADGTTITDLAGIYLEEGAAEHVRGDIAFAQSVLETGSFSVAPGNNFAGIGTCDSCDHGYAFPTPRDGVRAQIQLLKSYADPDSTAATLANPPSPALWANAAAYDNFFLKGKVPLWNQMGNGNWATAPDYAANVLTIYMKMIAYTAQHKN
jgi:Mannosyl-glycoprotein endo-beta-N-acetylglucosaminidase